MVADHKKADPIVTAVLEAINDPKLLGEIKKDVRKIAKKVINVAKKKSTGSRTPE